MLFARVTDSDFYEIHTASHGTWADLDLIEILHTNWPQAIEHRKLPQALALQYVPDTAAIEKLRKGKGKQGGKTNTLTDILAIISPTLRAVTMPFPTQSARF